MPQSRRIPRVQHGGMAGLKRRNVLTFLASCTLGLPASSAVAAQPTGVYDLDTPAISVKSVSSAFLVAVATAGHRIVAVGEHGIIIYSNDNGISWTQAKVPVGVTLTCVAFATPQSGWAAGHCGAVLHTSDGGMTWSVQLNGLEANQLISNAAQDVAIEKNPSPAAPLAMRRAGVFMTAGANKPFLSILILSPQKVFVFGSYRLAMATFDGGHTWQDWSLNIYDKLSNNLYASTSLGSSLYVVGESGLIFFSSDGGKLFLPISPPGSATLLGILNVEQGGIIIFGVAGNCYRSVNQGKNWTAVNLPTQDNLTVGLWLTSGRALIASEGGNIFLSDDSGVTFNQVTGLPPAAIFGGVETVDNHLIFVGGSGVIRLPASLNV